MKRSFCIVLLYVFAIVMFAQTQQGIVKTRGRLGNNGQLIPGERLSGVIVSVKNSGAYISGSNGIFNFAVPLHEYCIIDVQKRGYQLCDGDVLRKSYTYSVNPLVVVMDSLDKIIEDRLEAEGKIRATLTAQLNKQIEEINLLKEQETISQQEYYKLLQKLYDAQRNNENLISEMAERYSSLDFEEIDEFRREVVFYIQNGDLTRADSLLNTQGSMEDQEAELDSLHVANSKVRKDLQNSERMEEVLLRNFAENCYSRYEMCKLLHKNDSAAYWLELRAKKDSLNYNWTYDLGVFLRDYLADYNRSMSCFDMIEKNVADDENNIKMLASVINSKGMIFQDESKYEEALICYKRALSIREKFDVFDQNDLAQSYNNIAGIYRITGMYDDAIKFYNH